MKRLKKAYSYRRDSSFETNCSKLQPSTVLSRSGFSGGDGSGSTQSVELQMLQEYMTNDPRTVSVMNAQQISTALQLLAEIACVRLDIVVELSSSDFNNLGILPGHRILILKAASVLLAQLEKKPRSQQVLPELQSQSLRFNALAFGGSANELDSTEHKASPLAHHKAFQAEKLAPVEASLPSLHHPAEVQQHVRVGVARNPLSLDASPKNENALEIAGHQHQLAPVPSLTTPRHDFDAFDDGREYEAPVESTHAAHATVPDGKEVSVSIPAVVSVVLDTSNAEMIGESVGSRTSSVKILTTAAGMKIAETSAPQLAQVKSSSLFLQPRQSVNKDDDNLLESSFMSVSAGGYDDMHSEYIEGGQYQQQRRRRSTVRALPCGTLVSGGNYKYVSRFGQNVGGDHGTSDVDAPGPHGGAPIRQMGSPVATSFVAFSENSTANKANVRWEEISGLQPTFFEFMKSMREIREGYSFPSQFDRLFFDNKPMPIVETVVEDGVEVAGVLLRIPDLSDDLVKAAALSAAGDQKKFSNAASTFGTNSTVSTITNRFCFMINFSEKVVVTYHCCEEDPLEAFHEEWESGRHASSSIAKVVRTMIRRVVQTYSVGLAALRSAIDDISSDAGPTTTDTAKVQILSTIQSKASVYRRCATASQEAISQLDSVPSFADYVPPLLELLDTVISSSDELCMNARSLIDLKIALSEFTSNANLKLFTYITILFQPVTVATSWYGMNFQNMPELAMDNAYFIFVPIVWTLSIGIFVTFLWREVSVTLNAVEGVVVSGATRFFNKVQGLLCCNRATIPVEGKSNDTTNVGCSPFSCTKGWDDTAITTDELGSRNVFSNESARVAVTEDEPLTWPLGGEELRRMSTHQSGSPETVSGGAEVATNNNGVSVADLGSMHGSIPTRGSFHESLANSAVGGESRLSLTDRPPFSSGFALPTDVGAHANNNLLSPSGGGGSSSAPLSTSGKRSFKRVSKVASSVLIGVRGLKGNSSGGSGDARGSPMVGSRPAENGWNHD